MVAGEDPVIEISPPPVAWILWKLVAVPLNVLTATLSELVPVVTPVIEIAVPLVLADWMVVGAKFWPKISNAWALMVPVEPEVAPSMMIAPVPESIVAPCQSLMPSLSVVLALLDPRSVMSPPADEMVRFEDCPFVPSSIPLPQVVVPILTVLAVGTASVADDPPAMVIAALVVEMVE